MKDEKPGLREAAERAEQSGNYLAAFEVWRSLASSANRPDYLCKLGRMAQKLRRWGEAEKAFVYALNIDKAFWIAMTLLGSLFLSRTDGDSWDNARKAKKWLEHALAVKLTPMSLSLLGAAQNRLADKRAAINTFRKAIEVDESYEEAYFNLALLLAEQGEKGEAETLLRTAIQLDPDWHKAHGLLGVLLQERGRYSEAETELKRALEVDPTDEIASLYLDRLREVPGQTN